MNNSAKFKADVLIKFNKSKKYENQSSTPNRGHGPIAKIVSECGPKILGATDHTVWGMYQSPRGT